MPFQSKAQRRKFYALKSEGKMTQDKIDEWENDTPKNIPERIEKTAFWAGFEKRAQGSLTGGKGFVGGRGKMQLRGQLEYDKMEGPVGSYGRSTEDTKTDKTLLDRVRNPRSFNPFERGPELRDEANPHIVY